MHRGLRIPHLRKGDDSPLRIWLLHWIRNACHTQRLPTPRRRRYGHNVTSPTRLRHSTAEWFTQSLRLCSRDARCVRAISRGTCVEICDAVRLTELWAEHRCPRESPLSTTDTSARSAVRVQLLRSGHKLFSRSHLAWRLSKPSMECVSECA